MFFHNIRRRDHLQLAHDVLIACRSPTRITSILRQANLQWSHLDPLMTDMMKLNLLDCRILKYRKIRSDQSKTPVYEYTTTREGREIAKAIEDLYAQFNILPEIR